MSYKKIEIYAAMFFSFLMLINNAAAQDKVPITFGKIKMEDFTISSPLVDANTSAVIIADVGDTKFEGNSTGAFFYVYKRQTRIKIIDKRALSLATVKIPMYKGYETEGKEDTVSAVSYNIVNGVIVETKLNVGDVYDEKINSYYYHRKFVVPSVKEGSIIEYTYTVNPKTYSTLRDGSFKVLKLLPCGVNIILPLLAFIITGLFLTAIMSFLLTLGQRVLANI